MLGFGPIGSAPLGAIPLLYRVPASHTKEGKERLRAYYEALGRFVDMFARVETAITLTLWHYAQTNPVVAKIVFNGTSLDSSLGLIKQLAAATNAATDRIEDLEDVFAQVYDIKAARNSILHYGAESVAEGKAVVSNALKAKGSPDVFPVSPTALDDMTADLNKVIAHLNYVHLGNQPTTILGNPMHGAWRYKHPVRPRKRHSKAAGQQTPKRAAKPPRPPRPSRASRRNDALTRAALKE